MWLRPLLFEGGCSDSRHLDPRRDDGSCRAAVGAQFPAGSAGPEGSGDAFIFCFLDSRIGTCALGGALARCFCGCCHSAGIQGCLRRACSFCFDQSGVGAAGAAITFPLACSPSWCLVRSPWRIAHAFACRKLRMRFVFLTMR